MNVKLSAHRYICALINLQAYGFRLRNIAQYWLFDHSGQYFQHFINYSV